ncbi:uncharacterized protein FMAN_02084 [Fusarium mangiferae]|uniref:Fungal N-terminal domain-containing protein n=1 Tax=Fusarium mangiferae TaxID=192010 RepID=A0A1L7TU07_FUSMA|nr:uncharacterized protein FMAN_02084 [Fusarium mangiferae]CVK99175.1 uncharacterized protein FMAN_02084 [Fusarium mangiferae]
MSSTNTARISSSLHEAACAVFKLTQHNSRLQQHQLDQALKFRQLADSLHRSIDELEVAIMHLRCVPGSEAYFYQAQQHFYSFRLIENDLNKTLASITHADFEFGQEMRTSYAQFLSHISCCTSDDTQALASLKATTGLFDTFHSQQRQRLVTMRDQLDSLTLVMSKMAALKHGLEEQGLI